MSDRYDPSRVVGLGDPPAGGFPAGWGDLDAFNELGVLVASDVHVAGRLARLGGDPDPGVALAVALAVRAPRVGHVSVDLSRVREVAAADLDDDVDLSALPWPEPDAWLRAVAGSPLVACGDPDPDPDPATGHSATGAGAGAGAGGASATDPGHPSPGAAVAVDPVPGGGLAGRSSGSTAEPLRPLRLIGTALYLDRYWRDERLVAAELTARAARPAGAGLDGMPAGWERLLPDDADQRRAVLHALACSLTVLVGGPGTGKTTTVARLLALAHHEAATTARRPPLIALAAPTGKAAARLEEAVRAESARLSIGAEVEERLATASGSTLHRLLGARRSGSGGFRFHAGNRLPHDTVVVDEASMVSLGLMARLLEAVRPDARLVLVGDPDQLVSVEAGAVLADVTGGPVPAAAGPGEALGGPGRTARSDRRAPGAPPPIAAAVATLRTNHRSSGALAALAEAVRAGDADAALGLLGGGDPALTWLPVEAASAADDDLGRFRSEVLSWAEPMVRLARTGAAEAACAALGEGRVLCAHRRGPAGVTTWNERIESWVAGAVPEVTSDGQWYPGRPVLVTANDYSLQVFNGDAGVVVVPPDTGGPGPGGAGPGGTGSGGSGHDGPRLGGPGVGAGGGGRPARASGGGVGGGALGRVVAFAGRPEPIGAGRLVGVETVYAMTVHKAQGSELDRVALVLPPPASRLLTRELLYTAVTRARRRLLVVASEEAIRTAIGRRIERASGLGARLWGASGVSGTA